MAKGFSATRARVSTKSSRVLATFLRSLTPGMGVVLQYDCQLPAFGVYQGFQRGHVLLSEFNGFPGLVRIAADRVNAVSPFVASTQGRDDDRDDSDRDRWSIYGSVADFGCCGGYWW